MVLIKNQKFTTEKHCTGVKEIQSLLVEFILQLISSLTPATRIQPGAIEWSVTYTHKYFRRS